MKTRQLLWLATLALAATLFAIGCGNDGSSSGGSAGSGGGGSAASETPPTAEPTPPPPPPLKAKILGQWDVPLSSLVQTLPPEKRADIAALDFVFRETEPTEEEVKTSGLEGVKAFGVGLLRQEKAKNPNSEKVVKMRAAYDEVLKVLPTMEITENTLVLASKTKREASTYTILRESPENIVLKVVDNDDGEVEELTFTFIDDNTLVVAEEGDPDLTFHRHGVSRPAAKQAPDLRSDPAAARIYGRWKADDHAGEISLQPDGSYVLHGGGGDVNGLWRVDSIKGTQYEVSTTLGGSFALSSDNINIVANEDGSITWTNRGTKSTGRYTKVQ